MSNQYQLCNKCVMDTSDPSISFDSDGVCSHCDNYEKNILPNWNTENAGLEEIKKIASKIRASRKNYDFDCIIGLSGGLDSSYTAHVTKNILGLRPLLFHVDAGWNSDQAVENIEKIVDGLDSDLYTEVINWEEMKDLQIAFLKSQIADQDAPQDTAFFSALYKFARQNKIKHVFTGGNYSTESIREPEEWGAYPGIDKVLINDIYNQFGNNLLKTFPIISTPVYKIIYQLIFGMKIIKPLNYIPYIKEEAERELNNLYGWEPFKHKHHESRFTRFYEDFWLREKFGYDKRRAHFSSLILSGQMNRDDAIERLKFPELNNHFHNLEFEYVANKLSLSEGELKQIFNSKNKTFLEYKNIRWFFEFGIRVLKFLGIERRNF